MNGQCRGRIGIRTSGGDGKGSRNGFGIFSYLTLGEHQRFQIID